MLTKPCPSSPRSADAGIRQSAKITSLVSLARIPSLFSFLPAVMPGVPCSTMNAEIPRCALARSVTAMTTMTPPIRPWVMKVFAPFSAQPSAVARGRGPHPRGVAAGAGLGQAPGAEHAAADQPRQVGPLLLVAAEHPDVRRAQAVVRGHRQGHRRTHPRQLLDADAVVDRRHAGAAVLFRKLDAHQPERRPASAPAPSETAAPRPTP